MKIFNQAATREKRKQLWKHSTEAEVILWERLRTKKTGYKFFRQYGIGPYIADFYCPEMKLVIEIDGGQHLSEDATEYDLIRAEYMSGVGIRTIRFSNTDVIHRIEEVVRQIASTLAR